MVFSPPMEESSNQDPTDNEVSHVIESIRIKLDEHHDNGFEDD